MATYTTNLNLKKPAQSDKIRIADINNNMDDIDAAFGAIGNDSVATQIGDIQGALAIVAVGDSHAAITAGQYVYVKSHETLDTGLYVASANIAQNGALSSSNLTADTAGGLNALNSNIISYDLGMDSVLPSTVPDGIVGFGLSSNVVLDNTTIPAGTRFIGYVASGIGHFVGAPNGSNIYMIRRAGNSWAYLGIK